MKKTFDHKYIDDFQNEYDKCTLCGNCRMICPTFLVHKHEAVSCRGRVNLIGGMLSNDERVGVSKESEYFLNMCLNCKSCDTICPAKVDASSLIISARCELYDKKKLPFIKRLLFSKALHRNRLLSLFAFLGKIAGKITKNGEKKGWFFEKGFSLVGFSKERRIPKLKSDLLKSYKPKYSGTERKKVALFAGCSGRFIFSDTVKHTVELLEKAGYEVKLPKDQVCCGAPVLYNGDFNNAVKLANKNISVFSSILGLEAIITICGSCGQMLKNEYKKILKLNGFNVPVYDIMEFFALHKVQLKPKVDDKLITYHHSCHLSKGMGVSDDATDALKKGYEDRYVELTDADKCCGGGGTFNLTYYDTAKVITRNKLDNIENSEADILATGCPSCIMRIGEQRDIDGKNFEIKHTVELFDIE